MRYVKQFIRWFYRDENVGYLFVLLCLTVVATSTINLAGWLAPLVVIAFTALGVTFLLIGGTLAAIAEIIGDGIGAVGRWARR